MHSDMYSQSRAHESRIVISNTQGPALFDIWGRRPVADRSIFQNVPYIVYSYIDHSIGHHVQLIAMSIVEFVANRSIPLCTNYLHGYSCIGHPVFTDNQGQ